MKKVFVIIIIIFFCCILSLVVRNKYRHTHYYWKSVEPSIVQISDIIIEDSWQFEMMQNIRRALNLEVHGCMEIIKRGSCDLNGFEFKRIIDNSYDLGWAKYSVEIDNINDKMPMSLAQSICKEMGMSYPPPFRIGRQIMINNGLSAWNSIVTDENGNVKYSAIIEMHSNGNKSKKVLVKP